MARKSKQDARDRPNLAVTVLIDESGSMSGYAAVTIKAVNEYIKGLTLASSPAEITVVTFGSRGIRTIIDRRPSYELPKIDGKMYVPQGGTPLCAAMQSAMERLDKIDARQRAVIVITDGQDEGYGGCSKADIHRMVQARIKDGWLFLFVATNGMAKHGVGFGVPAGQSLEYNQNNSEDAMHVAAMATLRFQGGGKAVFTPEEKERAKGKKKKQDETIPF